MSNIDLSTNTGFAQATGALQNMGNTFGTLALLFGRPPEEWDIEEASYNDVVFHVFVSKQPWNGALPQIQDSGGRRLAKFQFPYTDGQTTDDLGRAPESFDLEIILFGNNYIQGLRELFAELQKPTPGELIHPVRGTVVCRMESYTLTHSHDSNKAVKINLKLVEHNFDLASYGTIALDANVKSVLGDLAKAFQQISALLTKLKGLQNFVNSVINTATAFVENMQNLLALSASNINTVFNKSSSQDIPTLKPTNLGGLLQVNSTLSATAAITTVTSNIATITNDIYTIATRINDPYTKIPVEQLTAATAIALAAQTVQKQIEDTRTAAEETITYLSAIQANATTIDTSVQTVDGSIVFYDEIKQIRKMMVDLQKAFELGLQQNRTRIIEYTTSRVMSLREVAFANNISLENISDIDILNPELLSVNYIPKNTVLKVPVA